MTYQWSGSLADGTETRVLNDLSCTGGATLRRACAALGLPTSGTKRRLSERLFDAGLDAATVRSTYGWKALHPTAAPGAASPTEQATEGPGEVGEWKFGDEGLTFIPTPDTEPDVCKSCEGTGGYYAEICRACDGKGATPTASSKADAASEAETEQATEGGAK